MNNNAASSYDRFPDRKEMPEPQGKLVNHPSTASHPAEMKKPMPREEPKLPENPKVSF